MGRASEMETRLEMNTAFPARLSRILANIPDATAFHVYDGRQLEAWRKEAQVRRAVPKQAPTPTRPALRVADVGRPQTPYLTMEEAAAQLHKSRRWLQGC